MTSTWNYAAFALLAITAAPMRPGKLKQILLLAMSYIFYAFWGFGFLTILVASSILNYAFGTLLRRRPSSIRLWIAVAANVSLLSFFKYLPALAPDRFFLSIGPLRQVVMPVGMSFWTFQALSYVFDVYREDEANPSLLEFCLYMAFWPTVLMGPINRLSDMLPQFRELGRPSKADLESGLRRIGAGLFMKLIVAQLLASGVTAGGGVDSAFDNVGKQWGGLDVWLLAIGFGFELFFDFAGYSNIVIGIGRLLGFRIAENFDSPYLASTPSLFWTKWHMSLSFWIRDYVFMPLAGLRRKVSWRHLALLLSMILFGLWHGPRLTFILWGAYQGILLVLHRIGQHLSRNFGVNMNGAVAGAISWVLTFGGISLGWILFRVSDVDRALQMFKAVVAPGSYLHSGLPASYTLLLLIVVVGYFLNWSMSNHINQNLAQDPMAFEASVVGQSWYFLKEHKRFWVVPAIVLFAVVATLMALSQGKAVAPFVYASF